MVNFWNRKVYTRASGDVLFWDEMVCAAFHKFGASVRTPMISSSASHREERKESLVARLFAYSKKMPSPLLCNDFPSH